METDPTRIENGDVSCDMRVSVKMTTGEEPLQTYCPRYAGLKGNGRAARLADKAAFISG